MRGFWCSTAVALVWGCGGPSESPAVRTVDDAQMPGVVEVLPHRATEPVAGDPDDPAIWIHPEDPSQSLIIGTDKGGALVVFDLQGRIVQTITGLDRPNNVDIGATGGEVYAVVTERRQHRLRFFAIEETEAGRRLVDRTGSTEVFEGFDGEEKEPMGIAMYHRPDGVTFAIVGRKTGPLDGYLGQYRVIRDPDGRVNLEFVRYFGRFSGDKEIEAIAVDDDLGYVYVSDEGVGVRKYHADPDAENANEELAVFADYPFEGDHEGIAIYRLDERNGYIVVTEQIEGDSRFHFFRREGEEGDPHRHRPIKIVAGGADDTDGIEIAAWNLGPDFPHGILVAMNSAKRNFLIYDWANLADTGEPRLRKR